MLHAGEYLNLVLRFRLHQNVLRAPAELEAEGEIRFCIGTL